MPSLGMVYVNNVSTTDFFTVDIDGFRGGAKGAAARPFFYCIFKTFLYDPNTSNRPLSVVLIIQPGFNCIHLRPPLSGFSGSALVELDF